MEEGAVCWCMRAKLCVWGIERTTDFTQCVSVRIKCGCEDINVHNVYRSPNSTSENDDKLCDWILDMRGINVLIGDFNFPDVDWETGTTGARGRKFYAATKARFMEQYVNGPTHVSGNTLDLILSDREGIVNAVRRVGRLGKSDHEILLFLMRVDEKREREERTWLNYRKAAYEQMRVTLKAER